LDLMILRVFSNLWFCDRRTVVAPRINLYGAEPRAGGRRGTRPMVQTCWVLVHMHGPPLWA